MDKLVIKNIEQLRLKKSEIKVTIHNQEIQLISGFTELKSDLFSFGSTEIESTGFGTLKKGIIPFISKTLVSLVVTKWLKPKSKLATKAAIFLGSSFIQKLFEEGGKKVIQRLQK
tara:strand:+ start:9923 stop:10267 length:345 start_codon:yes stop_codon:yes gene_type:complete